MSILKTPLTRRTVLKSTAIGAGVLAAPAIISSGALASSGEVNFTGWAGYPGMAEKVFPAFEKATGIKVNFTEQPDQDTMFAQAKISLATGTSDVVEPTLDRVSAWNSNGLLQGWDLKKLTVDNYAPGLADGSADTLATIDGQKLIVPSVWGTEALVYSTEGFPTEYGKASLADLFNPANQVTVRGHSALAAMGRWLDAEGKLPKPWIDGYKDEATMVELWDIALAEAIKAKGNIVQFWSGENDAQAAFRTNGAVLGLCWDSTGFNMKKEGGYAYLAPKEGAFAWNQGLVLLKSAKNIEQAHEFAKWVSTAEGSALWATAFSANPVGKGGIDLMDPTVSEFYKASFPGDAVSKMYWWPSQAAWFLSKRGEYADKYKAA
ncbi:spermidine/putrescine transport system substrate-binding protein [Pararhizobium capsulatum DSM 1112]|uniref:Spermidine/putrescine transport system substrate-binding protein n=1 Tax=Pararhizobium capsulatum DSM 1112 TaxID=1121113 RepID=A0ABU0BVH2_9HYPH|nr:extracellular solute-binding protein [Pararhizobium capsulatum]MDQ0322243.1 spermidine/putrescine transport system substrate-binding protein [Pararhizobium capsulatum DSM 1112]